MQVTLAEAFASPESRYEPSREDPEWRRRRVAARRLAPRCARFVELARRPFLPEYRLAQTHARLGHRLTPTELKVYGLVRAAVRAGFAGVMLTKRELGELVDTCERSVERAVTSLVALRVLCRVPQFVRVPGGFEASGRLWKSRQLASALVLGEAGIAPRRSRGFAKSERQSKTALSINGGDKLSPPTLSPLSGGGFSPAATNRSRDEGGEISLPVDSGKSVSPPATQDPPADGRLHRRLTGSDSELERALSDAWAAFERERGGNDAGTN